MARDAKGVGCVVAGMDGLRWLVRACFGDLHAGSREGSRRRGSCLHARGPRLLMRASQRPVVFPDVCLVAHRPRILDAKSLMLDCVIYSYKCAGPRRSPLTLAGNVGLSSSARPR